jgi:hypothetical protein
MMLGFLVWLVHLAEWFLGVEFRSENLNLKFGNLASVAAIIFITAVITLYSPLLQVIENMVNSLQTNWIYKQALLSFKFSFVTTPLHLSLVCLFKDVENPILKFKNTFAALVVGFIGAYVMVYLIQAMPESIPSEMLSVLWVYPLIMIAIVRVSISQEIRN